MTVEELHRNLLAAGFTLRADGGTLRVSPASRVGQGLQRLIRQHKRHLLRLVGMPEPPPLTGPEREDIEESIEERAAILEYDAGLPRGKAETQAASAMRAYRLLVAMDAGEPPKWVTMLAPNTDLAEAEHGARTKFGARLLAIFPHSPAGALFTTET